MASRWLKPGRREVRPGLRRPKTAGGHLGQPGYGQHDGVTNGHPGDGEARDVPPAGGQTLLQHTGPRRHDPRIDPPTKADRRRLWRWAALLAFCPICLGVVVWAALGMNGSYPTVKPPVPAGWQSVPGIYASFSVPGGWSLKQFLSDASGDVYYSGAGGGVGESVTQADRAPERQRAPAGDRRHFSRMEVPREFRRGDEAR